MGKGYNVCVIFIVLCMVFAVSSIIYKGCTTKYYYENEVRKTISEMVKSECLNKENQLGVLDGE